MKLKKLFLVSSLFLAGGLLATGSEVTNSVKAATGDTYKLVTDVSTLAAGDVVIIASSDGTAAMSTTQNNNNRGQVTVTKTDDSIAYVTNLQEFTLEEGTTTGTFAFNTGSGYIYAASTSSNRLRTETTLSANSSWNITIASDGVATVKATGTNTRNWLRYNKNSKLFSCYASGQNDISIYEKVVDTASYRVDLDAGLSSFNDDVTTYYKGTVGSTTSITMPSLTDLTNNGLIYAGTAKVSGWTDGTNNYELGQTYEFTDKATLTPTYTQLTSEITIAKANEICEEVGSTETIFDYKTKGKVSSINTEYSESNDNITLTISDDDSAIKCYKLTSGENSNASSLKIGDIIIVTGKLIKYSGTNEFNTNCTFEDVVLSATDMFQEETTTTKLTASYTKTTKVVESDNAKYSYEFTKKVFGSNESQPLGDVNWTLGGTYEGSGYWDYFNAEKGQQFGKNDKTENNVTTYNHYTSMTLTSETSFKNVSSITINTSGASGTNAVLTITVGGTQIGDEKTLTKENAPYTFTLDTPLTGAVEFSYTQTSSKGLYIKSVEITYTDTIEQSTYTVNKAKIGFATLMSSKSYDASAKYGILVVPTDELNATGEATIKGDIYQSGQSLNDLIADLTEFKISYQTYEITPVKCDVNGAKDENGDYYQFGVVFNGSLAKKDISLTAVAYMKLNGQVYLTSNETTYSLKFLAQAYIDNCTFTDNADAIGVLNSIING